MPSIEFDYSKLRGKIREVCYTQGEFAEKIGMGRVSLSKRLNNQLDFSNEEIYKACSILGIPCEDVSAYFFKPKVQKYEQTHRSSA